MRLRAILQTTAAAIILQAGGVTCNAQLMPSPWPAFRHDSFHTGRGTTVGPESPTLAWYSNIGGTGLSSPAVGQDVVYVVGQSSLIAFDTGGSVIWSFPIIGGGRSSPAVAADGTIYVASTESKLYAINADGTLKWKKTLPGPTEASPTIGPDGTVYIGCSTGAFEAYRSNGTLKYTYMAGGAITSSAALGQDGTAYFGCADGCLYAVYATGALRWRFQTMPSGMIESSPSVGADGTVYFGTMNGFAYAVLTTGTQRWRYGVGGGVFSSPALAEDGTVYFGCRDGYLYALGPIGALKWKHSAGQWIDSSPAVDVDGDIYVGCNNGFVYAVAPNGTRIWETAPGAGIQSSPALGKPGALYVTTYDGLLCCFGTDGTPPTTPVVTDDGNHTSNPSELHAWWTSTDMESGIAKYEYAIGTTAGAEDIVPFTDVGLATEITVTGLTLVSGADYYFAVRATNGVDMVSEVGVSDGIRVDLTPPAQPVVIDDGEYTASTDTLHVVYSSGDVESGIDHYEYCVGTSAGSHDVLDWQYAGTAKEQTITGLPLSNGVMYFISILAFNRAGLWSEASSDGILADLTDPGVTNITASALPTEMRVTIDAQDPESGITGVECALVTPPGPPPDEAWVSGQPGEQIIIPGIFTAGQAYYAAVRATNGAGTVSDYVITQAVFLDQTPPETPVVTDDGDYWGNTSQLHACWSSEDPESGIDHYSYCVGTAPGSSDVKPWADTTESCEIITGLALQHGVEYFITVTAFNGVWLASVPGYSDGIVLDTTPPSQPVVVDDGSTTSVQGILHASCSSDDPESGVAEYSYCIGTSPGAQDVVEWTSAGSSESITAYNLELETGVQYYFTVKARNAAGLWSTEGSSNGIEFWPGVSVWPQFRCDSRNTGRCTVSGPALGQQVWRVQTTGYVESSPAIAGDGTAYIGSSDGKLYALGSGGTVRWTYQTGGSIDSSPAIGPTSEIYFGSNDHGLYCLYPNGMLKWRFAAEGMVWSSPAIGIDGTIYFGCRNGYLYAVYPDGTQRWRYQSGGAIWSSPAVMPGGNIYFGCGDGKLHAVTPEGSTAWTYQTGSSVDSSPCVGNDGSIYFGSGDGYFYSLKPDGTLRWRYHIGNVSDASPAVTPGGTVYTGSGGPGVAGALHAFSSTGVELWRIEPGAGVKSSPAVDQDGRIYFGTTDGTFYALAPDGSVIWTCAAWDSILGSAGLAPDGSIVVGSDDGGVYCFRDAVGDTTKPTKPVVQVQPQFLIPGAALSGSWSSSDPESGIDCYWYAVGTQPGETDCLDWTSTGIECSMSRSDLPLTAGEVYYVSVKARNGAGLMSDIGVSDGVLVMSDDPLNRIGNAKKLPEGTQVLLSGKVVTARFDDCVFIEEPDRSSGIRCVTSSSGIGPNMIVNAAGVVGRCNGEIVLENAQLALEGTPAGGGLAPIAMSIQVLTGEALSAEGLLIRTAGRVTRVGADYFVIYDGSYLYSPRGAPGIEVRTSSGVVPGMGTISAVTGVACREMVEGVPVPVIRCTDDTQTVDFSSE